MRLVITAGPTRERIDPVRFISNSSTGVMGAELAREALRRGHRVALIHGPCETTFPVRATRVPIENAAELEQELRRESRQADVVIMAAAVADFRPTRIARRKIPRRRRLALQLEPTPDVIGQLPRRSGLVVAGFALETQAVLARARRKLREKRLDVVVAQDASKRSPFGKTMLNAWLLSRDGAVTRLGWRSKRTVARALLDKVEALWYGQQAVC